MNGGFGKDFYRKDNSLSSSPSRKSALRWEERGPKPHSKNTVFGGLPRNTIHLGYRCPSTGAKRPLPGKLRKKSEKRFPGPLGPGVKRGSKKSRK